MEKIQELTEKLYHEGVEKGQEEAARIVEQGKNEAERIIAQAREQAQAIEAQAKKQAAELDANTKSELKLYTGQAMSALKSEIVNLLTERIAAKNVAQLVEDKEFIGKFTVALASKWAVEEPIVISTEDAEQLKAYFAKEAKELLDKGVTIEKVHGVDAVFTIQPQDGSYHVSFGKEEFESYFKTFLRPQLVEMLFA